MTAPGRSAAGGRSRPWFPGAWAPAMAERGMSVWNVALDADTLEPFAYEEERPAVGYQPNGPAIHYRVWTSDGAPVRGERWRWWTCSVIAPSPIVAIETAQANVRWWAEPAGWSWP